jgi:hypothetical protein
MDQFLLELMEIFPENNSIKTRYVMFKTLVTVNPEKLPNEFMVRIIPYLGKIAARDNNVFIGDDAPDIINKLNINKYLFLTLSENNKNALWQYLKSFIQVGSKVVEMPQETQKIINYIITN